MAEMDLKTYNYIFHYINLVLLLKIKYSIIALNTLKESG